MISGLLLALLVPPAVLAAAPSGMAQLPAGSYTPFFSRTDKAVAGAAKPVHVGAFFLDPAPVTNGDFLRFVRAHPAWRKSKVARIQADAHYLQGWARDLRPGKNAPPGAPVTSVSWFAAQAYCESRGASLPTVDQWEYALDDLGREREAVKAKALKWYGEPNPVRLEAVKRGKANGFGIYDLTGLIWEWTLDFNSFLVTNETRAGEGPGNGLFCGNGGAGALDSADYASFMRYSLRFSLKAAYTTANLGFRCAKGEDE